jgi:hypothetical protein
VYVNRGVGAPGSIARVRIEEAGDYDLVGGIEGADGPAVALAPAQAEVARIASAEVSARMPRPRFPILSH